jgi:hypothetical protein
VLACYPTQVILNKTDDLELHSELFYSRDEHPKVGRPERELRDHRLLL